MLVLGNVVREQAARERHKGEPGTGTTRRSVPMQDSNTQRLGRVNNSRVLDLPSTGTKTIHQEIIPQCTSTSRLLPRHQNRHRRHSSAREKGTCRSRKRWRASSGAVKVPGLRQKRVGCMVYLPYLELKEGKLRSERVEESPGERGDGRYDHCRSR